ncbi:MAG: Xaa-Pro aminopeptidase, partial [Ignavibacteriae bacterium]|nr:Xaa-Pro aminopeptidase [Ignavibacteriota bacterium]
TVEPGLYFPEDAKEIPAKYRGIGVRIEDDVLVTKHGSEVLSDALPKKIADIEKLMK